MVPVAIVVVMAVLAAVVVMVMLMAALALAMVVSLPCPQISTLRDTTHVTKSEAIIRMLIFRLVS